MLLLSIKAQDCAKPVCSELVRYGIETQHVTISADTYTLWIDIWFLADGREAGEIMCTKGMEDAKKRKKLYGDCCVKPWNKDSVVKP